MLIVISWWHIDTVVERNIEIYFDKHDDNKCLIHQWTVHYYCQPIISISINIRQLHSFSKTKDLLVLSMWDKQYDSKHSMFIFHMNKTSSLSSFFILTRRKFMHRYMIFSEYDTSVSRLFNIRLNITGQVILSINVLYCLSFVWSVMFFLLRFVIISARILVDWRLRMTHCYLRCIYK
jgi:hypothetical protein